MKLLLDEGVPFSLSRLLEDHECFTVAHMGWRGTKNGVLLRLAEEADFDVLITLDSGLPAQQNLKDRRIGVLVLRPEEQGKRAILQLAPNVLRHLQQDISGSARLVVP